MQSDYYATMLNKNEEIFMTAISKVAMKQLNGKSLSNMAFECNLGTATISEILNGEKNFYITTIAKFAEGNKMKLSEFIKEVETVLPKMFSLID